MNEIKPIETFYNGYRFRSRLEARWAVFFDKSGIPYEYEPEGFDLNECGYYLPDFYLPWFDAYVEIKPKHSNQITDAINKLCKIFDNTEHAVLLCVGDPADNDIRIYCNDATESSGGGPNEWEARFLEGVWWTYYNAATDSFETESGTGKHFISLAIGPEKGRDREFFTSSWGHIKNAVAYNQVTHFRDDFCYAKICARQARFEHGETPKQNNKVSFLQDIDIWD